MSGASGQSPTPKNMRNSIKTITVILAAAALMLLFRSVAFTIYTVPQTGIKPWLVSGDRVLVNRWSYGLRTGGERFFPYSRWFSTPVGKGELVAFNYPLDTLNAVSSRPVHAAFCMAAPGDTVMIGHNPIIPPKKCRMVEVKPWNIKLLCNTYRIHEHRNADIIGGKLFIDGKETRYAYFSKNYYWMSVMPADTFPDSRFYGFVPEDHIIGRIVMIVYSKGNSQSFFGSFRNDRWFKPL